MIVVLVCAKSSSFQYLDPLGSRETLGPATTRAANSNGVAEPCLQQSRILHRHCNFCQSSHVNSTPLGLLHSANVVSILLHMSVLANAVALACMVYRSRVLDTLLQHQQCLACDTWCLLLLYVTWQITLGVGMSVSAELILRGWSGSWMMQYVSSHSIAAARLPMQYELMVLEPKHLLLQLA